MSDGGGIEGSKRKKVKHDEEIDVAPLIDCTFILLMYFIVLQALSPRMDANVPAAEHGSAMKQESASIITIKNNPTTQQTSILYGEDGKTEGTVAGVTTFVEDGLRKQKNNVIIMADREVPHGVVQQVLKAAAKVDGVKLGIAVQDKKKK